MDTTQEKHSPSEDIIIVGCGRVGVELALSISRQNFRVAVVDVSPRAFDRLGPDFRGRTVQGEGIDQEVLKRAGIESAHGFAAVTTSDSVNIVAARVARDIYKIEHVVARVYNPRRANIYEKLGLQTIASSSWGAQRIEQLLLHSGLKSVHSAGNGEVQLYEVVITDQWAGRPLSALTANTGALPVSLTRGGRASIPTSDAALQVQDILHISATAEGAASLENRLNGKG